MEPIDTIVQLTHYHKGELSKEIVKLYEEDKAFFEADRMEFRQIGYNEFQVIMEKDCYNFGEVSNTMKKIWEFDKLHYKYNATQKIVKDNIKISSTNAKLTAPKNDLIGDSVSREYYGSY